MDREAKQIHFTRLLDKPVTLEAFGDLVSQVCR